MGMTPYNPDGVAGHRNVDTSIKAARRITKAIGPMHNRIFAYFTDHHRADGSGGRTCEQVCRDLGLKLQTATGRLRELVVAERLKIVPDRQGTTASGSPCRIYDIVGHL